MMTVAGAERLAIAKALEYHTMAMTLADSQSALQTTKSLAAGAPRRSGIESRISSALQDRAEMGDTADTRAHRQPRGQEGRPSSQLHELARGDQRLTQYGHRRRDKSMIQVGQKGSEDKGILRNSPVYMAHTQPGRVHLDQDE